MRKRNGATKKGWIKERKNERNADWQTHRHTERNEETSKTKKNKESTMKLVKPRTR